jgi:hypothetical protein
MADNARLTTEILKNDRGQHGFTSLATLNANIPA